MSDIISSNRKGRPELSAVVAVGPQRARSQRCLDGLFSQTALDAMEIVVVDVCGRDFPPLEVRTDARVTYLASPRSELWSAGRVEALEHVTSPVVAYMEEHCVAEPDWAEKVIAAHDDGPWAAVGYGFENANPETYLSCACFVSDYGLWTRPARSGESRYLPGHNISYKRDVLTRFGDRLERLLTPDFSLHEILRGEKRPMYFEAHAVVRHENFEAVWQLMQAHHAYARLLSSRRAEVGGWGRGRRLFYGLAVLPAAPAIGLARLYWGLRGRSELAPEFLKSLPVCVATRCWAGLGESLGYLAGEGDADRHMHYWEAVAERSRR